MEEQVSRAVAQDIERIVGTALQGMLADLERFKSTQHGRQAVLSRVEGFQRSAGEALENLQDMINGLGPWSGLGPSGSGVDLEAEMREALAFSGVAFEISTCPRWPRPMNAGAARELTRIAQEAVQNARRHGGATRVSIMLRVWSGHWATLLVRDNGRGLGDNAHRPGLGMRGMGERAIGLGGRLKVRGRPGGGVTVGTIVPLERLR